MKIDHFRQYLQIFSENVSNVFYFQISLYLGVRYKLEYPGSDFNPEVEEDARSQELFLLGVTRGTDVLQVDSPQLGEDEGVEEGAHVHHGGLALLREPRQDNLSSEVR